MGRNEGWPTREAGLLAVVLVAVLHGLAAHAEGDTYRWVDDEGEVHYGDNLPPEEASDEHDVVDDTGAARETRSPDDGEDDQSAQAGERTDTEEAGEEGSATAAASDGAEPRSDELLRGTFSSEEMLLDTRDRRLKAIQGRIDLTQQNIEQLEASLERRRQRLASLADDSDQQDTLQDQIDDLEQRLAEQRERLKTLESEADDTRAQFEADLERYREITADE
jgi:chromosome segregation ATPase